MCACRNANSHTHIAQAAMRVSQASESRSTTDDLYEKIDTHRIAKSLKIRVPWCVKCGTRTLRIRKKKAESIRRPRARQRDKEREREGGELSAENSPGEVLALREYRESRDLATTRGHQIYY